MSAASASRPGDSTSAASAVPEPASAASDPCSAALARGWQLENSGDLVGALACYDEALARATGPRPRGLAEMNRGNALQRIGTAEAFADALAAYDTAIECLSSGALAVDPLLRNHLGVAWLNRGHALLALSPAAARPSFERAVAELSLLPVGTDPFFALNLAGARANLAHTLLGSAPGRALTLAREALALVAADATTHSDFALMSLRARRTLVLALDAAPLPADLAARAAAIAAATDAVDDGLELARRWEARGFAGLRPLALQLFRLGTRLYLTHQPHFLPEFLDDSVSCPAQATDPDFHLAALEAVATGVAECNSRQLLLAGTVETQRHLATVRALRTLHERLNATRPSA